MTFFIQSYTLLIGLCEIVQFLLNTVIIMISFVLGKHRAFVAAIVTCEFAISILRKLRFGVCHQNFIHMTYFSVYITCISELYRVIVSYGTTPG